MQQLFREKIIPHIFNYILARTFSYCNSEPAQHSKYAELGFTYLLFKWDIIERNFRLSHC